MLHVCRYSIIAVAAGKTIDQNSLMQGFLCACTTSPFDCIKSRFMNASPTEYSSSLNCLVRTVSNEGVFALYKVTPYRSPLSEPNKECFFRDGYPIGCELVRTLLSPLSYWRNYGGLPG